MAEFRIDNLPNDDSFDTGENTLSSQEDFLPAIELLSYVSDESPEELQEYMQDFRLQAMRGNHTLRSAYQTLQDPSYIRRTSKQDFIPVNFSGEQLNWWANVNSGLTWVNSVVQIDSLAGTAHETVTRGMLHDPKSPNFIGQKLTERTTDLAAFREKIAQYGGVAPVVLSLESLQEELQAQIDWAYVVSGVNALAGLGVYDGFIPQAKTFYPGMAQDALKLFTLKDRGERIEYLHTMKLRVAEPLSKLQTGLGMPDNLIGHSQMLMKKPSAIDGESKYIDRVRDTATRAIDKEKERQAEVQKAHRIGELHAAYTEHAENATPALSGKARKREGYENMWNVLIGRTEDKSVAPILDHEATRVIATLHALRKMVEPSFDGVRDAQIWQQETRAYEQALAEEYAALGHQKGLPLKEGVSARLDWLGNNWGFVAAQARAIPEFPVQRVAAALFPEVAATIQEQERAAERQQATVAQRLGSTSLEQLVVQEVDWEILPVERVADSIRQEAERMTRGKQRSVPSGRRALQEVRVRDLIELSTLFDDAVVHVSREKEGITRRKNEPYFVITFSYGGQHFALAENLVLDNATFLLTEGEFDWRDVFSLPRGAVGEFGAKRINHPSVDESGEYEGGPSTHVNAIFSKLDKALAQ